MVQQQIQFRQMVHIHTETTNQSFIDMHFILKEKGIKNNDFFLVLFDTDLIGVDPRDPMLTQFMQAKILREIMHNYWYFIREVVRIPDQGVSISSGARYKLHRGNLAMNFLFTLNYNMFVELPRQHFKTMSALCRYLWVFNFGSTNSEIMFIHKNHGGSKENLGRVKRLREALPKYLQMSSVIGADGKKLKVSNTVETLQHPTNYNTIKTLPSARNKALANNLGRGCTMPLHYYDEFAFIIHNKIIYSAATPAYKTASKNAKLNGAPYGILITTTPGDLQTDEGNYAYDVRNSATPWNENYYDLTYDQLEELRKSNTNSSFFHIKFTYQQLGSGEDYFKEMVVDLNRDWEAIRREVLLEWARIANNCPFKREDLELIEQHCREPIRTMLFGRAGQYQFNIYEDLDLRYPPIIGVDVSGAMYQDSSAITVIDSKSTRVTATFSCNYIPTDDLAELIYTLVKNYMPNAVVNVESNGGFGGSVLQRLVKTDIKKNLYYEIKDKVLEERSNGIRTIRNSVKVKVYGLNSTKEKRARLIELLYERVNYHKDKFVAKPIFEEMQAMEVKKNGKVEHSSNSHDDQVFSYLMAIYVWYDGQDLMERYGIMKNSIKTDEDIEEVITDLESESNTEVVLDDEDVYDEETKQQLEVLSSTKIILSSDFEKMQHEKDLECLNRLMEFRPAKEAYIKKYNIDANEASLNLVSDIGSNRKTIPDQMFLDFNDDFGEQEYDIYAGNLAEEFKNLL